MRKLFHCRRGSVAFAMIAATVPLIGAITLGTEAGSWYVTQRNAQNAADSAAIAGALTIQANSAATLATITADATPFATRNGFTASEVTISQPASNQAKAVIIRAQPQLLSKLLYTAPASGSTPAGNVRIPASAVAQVYTLAKPCLLALSGPIHFQGSPTVNAPTCGMQSDSTGANSIDFTGNGGINISNVASISGAGGCTQTASAGLCSGTNVLTYGAQPADPLAALNSVLSTLSNGVTNFPDGQCATPGPVAYSTASAPRTACYNGVLPHGMGNAGGFTFPSAVLNGTYFFVGPVTISGSIVISGTATLVLLPGASLSITGTPSIQLTDQVSIPSTSVPAPLNVTNPATSQPYRSLMAGLLIYDPETTTGNNNGNGQVVNMTGDSTSYFKGVIYAPNADVVYTGASSTTSAGYGCNEVIAASVKYAGNTSYIDNSQCPVQTAPINYVALVQ